MPHQKILQFFPPDNTKKQRKKNNEVYLYLEKTKKNETKRSNARVTKKSLNKERIVIGLFA